MVPQSTHYPDEDLGADSERSTDIEEGDSESDEENSNAIGVSTQNPVGLPFRPEPASFGIEGESSRNSCLRRTLTHAG